LSLAFHSTATPDVAVEVDDEEDEELVHLQIVDVEVYFSTEHVCSELELEVELELELEVNTEQSGKDSK
jgi:hypothetical protein